MRACPERAVGIPRRESKGVLRLGVKRQGLVARLVLAGVLVTLAAGSVQAQVPSGGERDPRARGPYRGLFGGNAADPNSRQSLDLYAGLFGGYDDDVTGAQGQGGAGGGGTSPGDPRAQASSDYLGGSLRLQYRRSIVDRLSFSANAGANSSYYRDLDDLLATSYNAGAALNWAINNRTRLSLTQSFQFSPFFSFAVFPIPGVADLVDVAPVPGFDTRVVRQDNYGYGTSLSFSRQTTRRSTFSADANYQRTDFAQGGDFDYQDAQNWGAGARWSYSLSRSASARLGYAYRTGNYAVRREDAGGEDPAIHTLDVGIDYAKALSFSRNTRLSFSTGTAAFRSVGQQVDASADGDFRFTVIGNARLTHALGQSWVAALTYNRDLQLVNGFSEPFLTDAVVASIGGFLGPRVRLTLATGVNWGDYGYGLEVDADRRRTRTAYVTPALQFALTSYLAVEASYFYYRYRFDEGAAVLPDGFLPRYERQGFRVGLSTWVPLLR